MAARIPTLKILVNGEKVVVKQYWPNRFPRKQIETSFFDPTGDKIEGRRTRGVGRDKQKVPHQYTYLDLNGAYWYVEKVLPAGAVVDVIQATEEDAKTIGLAWSTLGLNELSTPEPEAAKPAAPAKAKKSRSKKAK